MEIGQKTDVFQSEDIWGTCDWSIATFRVYRNGSVVYEGRAEVYPDGGQIKVYVNRVVRGLLDGGALPTETGLTQNPDGVVEATLEFEDEDSESVLPLTTVRVYEGAGEFPQTGKAFTSDPINGHASPAMLLFLSHSARYSFQAEIS